MSASRYLVVVHLLIGGDICMFSFYVARKMVHECSFLYLCNADC